MTVCPHCGQEALTTGPVCPLCRGDLGAPSDPWVVPEPERNSETRPEDPGLGAAGAEARPAPSSSGGVRIYRHPVLANVTIVQTALQAEGIASEIRGAYGRRMTYHALDVELWLVDDSQEARAREIVEVANQAPQELPGWTCAECGEEVEGHYAQCWRCGAEAPGLGHRPAR